MLTMIPTVMVRNEERFIQAVLRPLVAVCGHVLVGDTGSTDTTPDLAAAIPGVEVVFYGERNPAGLRDVRADLGRRAAAAGSAFQLLCDGDELYAVATLEHLVAEGLPAGKRTGFTTMLTLDQDGEIYYELSDTFSRQAVMPAPETWTGEYPFEIPRSYTNAEWFHYFSLPPGYRYHAVHLHRLERSSRDPEVYLRLQKQKQFSMVTRPEVVRVRPFDLDAWEDS